MGLEHQALEAQVEGLLGNLGQVLPLAAHVGRIDENGEFRIAAAELHGHLPLGNIAVTGLLIGRETAVNGTQLAHSGTVQALQRSYPQVQVRIHRILHEHRYVGVPEGIRYLLHQERIAGGTGSYPDQVHSVFQALIDVLFAGNLGTDLHPEFLLYLLHPLQSGNAHASVDIPLPASCLTLNDNLASIELGEVPYLLEEDFSTAVPTAHDDDYTASSNSDRNVAGYLLDGYLPRNGWNAARFAIFEGDCIRINCRYQSGAWVVERWCGRLDTPAMSYLKPDASVTVVVEYDEAFYVPAGYNRDDSATAMACYRIGTHSNAESSKLDGCKSDNIASNASIVFTSERFASEDVSAMHSRTQEIASVGATTRIVFFADTGRTTSVVADRSALSRRLQKSEVRSASERTSRT